MKYFWYGFIVLGTAGILWWVIDGSMNPSKAFEWFKIVRLFLSFWFFGIGLREIHDNYQPIFPITNDNSR